MRDRYSPIGIIPAATDVQCTCITIATHDFKFRSHTYHVHARDAVATHDQDHFTYCPIYGAECPVGMRLSPSQLVGQWLLTGPGRPNRNRAGVVYPIRNRSIRCTICQTGGHHGGELRAHDDSVRVKHLAVNAPITCWQYV